MEAATHTVCLTVAPEHAWLRVGAHLAQVLPWRSRRSLTERLAAGAVAVNGRRVKKAHRLAAGDVVALVLPRRPEGEVDLATIPLQILYEDDELVVVDKPGDLAVHPASTCQHRNLQRRLQHYYAHEHPDPHAEPFVLHRLDRTTSGVVALAKRRELMEVAQGGLCLVTAQGDDSCGILRDSSCMEADTVVYVRPSMTMDGAIETLQLGTFDACSGPDPGEGWELCVPEVMMEGCRCGCS